MARLTVVSLSFVFSLVTSLAASPQSLPATQAGPSHQQPQLIPRTPAQREIAHQRARRIVLNVQVSNASNHLAQGLKPTDFTLLDNKQPAELRSFRSVQAGSSTTPAQIILVLDAVNNPLHKAASFRKEIEKYLKNGDGLLTNPTSIAVLSDAGMRQGPVSQDRNALLQNLKSMTAHLQPNDCASTVPRDPNVLPYLDGFGPLVPNPKLECHESQLYTSWHGLTGLLKAQFNVPVRVILIWTGRGWPLFTDRGYTPDTLALKENLFQNLVEISGALRESQVTLNAIAFQDPAPASKSRSGTDAALVTGVANASEMTLTSLGLYALASQSGGQIFVGTRDIAGQIADCVSNAQSYYVLAFDSPTAARPEEFHSVQVKVANPALKARTNTFYYAER